MSKMIIFHKPIKQLIKKEILSKLKEKYRLETELKKEMNYTKNPNTWNKIISEMISDKTILQLNWSPYKQFLFFIPVSSQHLKQFLKEQIPIAIDETKMNKIFDSFPEGQLTFENVNIVLKNLEKLLGKKAIDFLF